MKLLLALPVLVAALAACGGPPLEAVSHDDHGDEEGGATFTVGKGISLVDETQKAIGLKTAEVASVEIQPVVDLTAQIYQPATADLQSPVALATASVDPATAERIRPGGRVEFRVEGTTRAGIVKAVDLTQGEAIGKVEVLFELADPDRQLAIGNFVPLSVRLPKMEVTGIPKSAVLETAVGKFAYVQNGEFLLRTPITTGIEGADTIEITDGLYEGDVVASQPVETLHLIELRATKGGGHCH